MVSAPTMAWAGHNFLIEEGGAELDCSILNGTHLLSSTLKDNFVFIGSDSQMEKVAISIGNTVLKLLIVEYSSLQNNLSF